MNDSNIHEKLRKLLALASQGVGGEKVNAQTLLEALMAKHRISLSELEGETRSIHWFKPERGFFEERLLLQVIHSVCLNPDKWKNPKLRKQIGVSATKAEAVEIHLRYQIYLAALKKEMGFCYSAFVQTNNIFHQDAPPAKESEVDMEEINRIALAMLGMKPVEIRRTLTHSPA